jgi:cytochrome c biogenesis protein
MSRLGVYITHLSILIILLGALIGSLFGFKGFVNILEGETVDRIFTRNGRGTTPRPLEFKVRCDDFRITYYDTNAQERFVKEYISTLTFLEDGREVMKKEVRVNHPLTFNGLRFYQSSYGGIPEITVTVERKNRGANFSVVAHEGEKVGIPESKAFFQILKFHPQIHNVGEGIAMAFFQPMATPQRFWLFKARPKLIEGYQFTFKGVTQREYTGLQVTKDPGVWIVWVGCILLVLGLMVAFFFSHQRIWVLIPRGKATILVSGTANKNPMAFERRFHRTIAALEREV